MRIDYRTVHRYRPAATLSTATPKPPLHNSTLPPRGNREPSNQIELPHDNSRDPVLSRPPRERRPTARAARGFLSGRRFRRTRLRTGSFYPVVGPIGSFGTVRAKTATRRNALESGAFRRRWIRGARGNGGACPPANGLRERFSFFMMGIKF